MENQQKKPLFTQPSKSRSAESVFFYSSEPCVFATRVQTKLGLMRKPTRAAFMLSIVTRLEMALGGPIGRLFFRNSL